MFFKIKSLAGLVRKNNKGRKKYKKLVSFLMIVCFIICTAVDWTIISLKKSMEDIAEKPLARQLEVMDNTKEGELYQQLKDGLEQEAGVGDVTWLIPFTQSAWNNTEEILYQKNVDIMLAAFFSGIKEYIISGDKEKLEKGEILIPEYIYGLGDLSNYEYISGKELVGKQISISVTNYNLNTEDTYTFYVVGTYDNIRSSCMNDLFFINDEEADEIYTAMNRGWEKQIAEIARKYSEELKDNPDMLNQLAQNPYTRHYIGIYVKPGYSVDSVKQEIEKICGQKSFEMQEADENLVQYYNMIQEICRLIFVMLLSVLGVSTIIMLISDIKRRETEIFVWKTMGYRKRDIMYMLVMEHLVLVIKAFLTAIIVSVVFVFAVNYVIQNCLPFYRRTIVIQWQGNTLWMIGAILMVSAVIAIIVAGYGIAYGKEAERKYL
ncbi:MAG: ABC transporter permease [Lachnospiraceae bacterium]